MSDTVNSNQRQILTTAGMVRLDDDIRNVKIDQHWTAEDVSSVRGYLESLRYKQRAKNNKVWKLVCKMIELIGNGSTPDVFMAGVSSCILAFCICLFGC
jgi:hypothetical protein